MLLSGAVFYGAGYSIALPALEPFWISKKASAAAHALEGCGDEPAGFAGLNEMSRLCRPQLNERCIPEWDGHASDNAWYLGYRPRFESSEGGFYLVERGHAFEQAFSQKAGHGPEFFGCVDGFDINGQGPVRLQVYVRPEAANGRGCVPTPALSCRAKAAVRWRRLPDTTF